jgi:hypothetical protein
VGSQSRRYPANMLAAASSPQLAVAVCATARQRAYHRTWPAGEGRAGRQKCRRRMSGSVGSSNKLGVPAVGRPPHHGPLERLHDPRCGSINPDNTFVLARNHSSACLTNQPRPDCDTEAMQNAPRSLHPTHQLMQSGSEPNAFQLT